MIRRIAGRTGFAQSASVYSARIDWGDGTRGTGTVKVRGTVLSVAARHTWRKPLRRGRIVVTVTDAATGGTLTIRRAVRIA